MPFLHYIQEYNNVSIVIRLLLAVFMGAVIGLERPFRRHDAGLRTFALVALGSCLVTVANLYLFHTTGSADTSRIPAGVISGIGFIGVGSIIVTSRREIRGLTTAAGLWVSAALGIALGTGMIYISIFAFILSLVTIRLLLFLSDHAERRDRVMEIYLETEDIRTVDNIRKYIQKNNYEIKSMEKHRDKAISNEGLTVLLEIDLRQKYDHSLVIKDMEDIDGVAYIEEIRS